uniref:Receptor ligand binding region domain-containing protein n=1 Tax=Plectus sambesii TaxID=2011161 RepID=A0A914UV40_9BILA
MFIKVVTVKVGLVGVKEHALWNEAVFHKAAKELGDDGLLDKDLSLELYSNESLECNDFIGAMDVMQMYYLNGVRAFIGPECSPDMKVTAKMAAVWNVPMMGFGSSAGYFVDKRTYPTLARVSFISTNGLTNSLIALIKYYNWTRVALVNGASNDVTSKLRSDDFRVNFPANGIDIVVHVTFPAGTKAQTIASSKELLSVKNNARIIVAMFGLELSNYNEFVEGVEIAGMKTDEYVYLIPVVVQGPAEYALWNNESISNAMLTSQDFYENMIVRLYRFSQCPLGGCPAEWRGPLLWPVVAMRLWTIGDATGENRPACRKGLSPEIKSI